MHDTMSHMVLAMVQMEKSFSGNLLDKTSVLKSKLDNLVGIIEEENESSKFKELVESARKQKADENEQITTTPTETTVLNI